MCLFFYCKVQISLSIFCATNDRDQTNFVSFLTPLCFYENQMNDIFLQVGRLAKCVSCITIKNWLKNVYRNTHKFFTYIRLENKFLVCYPTIRIVCSIIDNR
uniref:Uncharacterized protein n=1 Tax=Lactuca sativa TaxID=4236 RepID=A0A9R1UC54_LACSA|nr:hypothetical protein LSAT_V11C000506780 [Lactuca sativa]